MERTDRDRLIRLIDGFVFGTQIVINNLEWTSETVKELADHLLVNGVILPTLICGDRVWFIPKGLGEVCEATVVRVEYNYFTSPQEWIVIDYISSLVGKHEYQSRVDLMLGKTVFLTKEEAERELKEREKNG